MNKYGVIAIHGGNIEPGTSESARKIAKMDFLFYSNEKGDHVPSELFDNKEVSELLNKVKTVISIHGEQDTENSFVMIGGLDSMLGNNIQKSLNKYGFKTKNPPEDLNGNNPENVCNKGLSGKGVQLEISRKLRNELLENSEMLTLFCNSVRENLK